MTPVISSKYFISLACLFCLCLAPVVSLAASPQLVETQSYFKFIWGLLFVLGIILILFSLLRKRFSLLANTSEKNIKILEIKPLMGRKALCLITVKGNEYLLGISGDRINHLATLPNKSDLSFAATLKSSEADRQT
ncbi:MAG: flagellar biosynthetic protein FliO [Proteobacteria bacterium]|nr:flagellar biosynthetic protein FliO [Pseudomonadota bacterium]